MITKTKKNKEKTSLNSNWQAVSKAPSYKHSHTNNFPIQRPQITTENNPDDEAPRVFDNQDLSNQDFSYQDLSGASFQGCDLTNADFSHATLKEANFTGANLTGVKLKEADIENAILLDVIIDNMGIAELQALIEYLAKYYPHKLNLALINLTLLDLKRIDLSRVSLKGVNFSGCNMVGVNVLALDLSGAIISAEQINQALGRPPIAAELQKMFAPKRLKNSKKSNFGEQIMKLFQDDGFEWGIWDTRKYKGMPIEDVMKFGKKVLGMLSGKPKPKLEELQIGIKKNMDDKVREDNQEKKKNIEEKKRELLEQMKQKAEPEITKEENTQTKQVEIDKQYQKQLRQKMISIKGRQNDGR